MNVGSSIRPNRPDVSDRFPVAGFTVRTGGPSYFEVAVATDPALFLPEHQKDRDDSNFYSTHDSGPLPADGGEAVYLLPPGVLSRFAGRDRLYYAMATFADRTRANPEVMRIATEAAPSIVISRSFSGRTRAIGVANARGGLTGYHGRAHSGLEWAGDAMTPGKSQPVTLASAKPNGSSGSNGKAPAVTAGAASRVKAQAVDVPYDDGYGPIDSGSPSGSGAGQAAAQDDGPGIEGGIPDAAAAASPQAYARPQEASEYSQASRFVPANAGNYRASSGQRTIRRIVIHITDGGANINGPISWFQNPQARVSAHYIVGQDGEVVQMVHHNDVAWHAHTANGDSIGIEHVANTHGLAPTESQYCASAALVNWLCGQYSIDMNRTNVLGHSEADPRTTHRGCPNAVWDWDYYMGMVTSATCYPRPTAQSLSAGEKQHRHQKAHAAAAGAGASYTRPLDDGYFTDTDQLDQYMADTRASDTTMLSTKDAAKAIVATFRANTAASPWTSLDRAGVADRLNDLIDNPRLVQQGALNLCGPAVFFCTWAGRDPVAFATFATRLYDSGSANIGSMTVAPTDSLKTKDYAQMLQRMGSSVSPQADWMLLGALKNSDDPFWQPRWVGDPTQEVAGMTTPEDVTSWLRATGVWNRVDNQANWATLKGIPHATNITFGRETDIALLINVNMLAHAQHPESSPETSWILSQFPDHYVMLVNEVVPSADNTVIDLSIWSWGRTIIHMRVPANDFLNNYYGAIVCRGLRQQSTAQSLGTSSAKARPAPRPPARTSTRPLAYNIIRPTYTPSNPDEAKRFLLDWQGRRQRWRAGVQDTTIFPHSAICRFRIFKSDGEYIGTGFYIDRDLILTCAHNVDGASSLTVIPGKNDLAATPEPFGSFSVNSSAWTIHPQYNANADTAADPRAARNFDLAVIRVSTAPPNGLSFPVLEELLQSQSSPILVCGYAAESVSADRQHLDGDQIVNVQDERFDYDIQTEGGNSGSPVFYLYGVEDEQAQMSRVEYHIIGVHTHLGADPSGGVSQTVNGGCRLTQAKIQWINSFRTRSTGQALGLQNGHKRDDRKHLSHAHAVEAPAAGFDDAAVQRMRAEATGNAARAATTTDTVAFLNSALRSLFNSALRNPDGTDKPLGAAVQDTMSALQGYGFAEPKTEFEFADDTGGLTRGVARPDHLRESLEQWVRRDADAAPWRCLGMALLDGYHGVILAASADKVYWIDQIYGGFDDVTGGLDRRIAMLTQRWWDPEDPARKPRTRISVWPLCPPQH